MINYLCPKCDCHMNDIWSNEFFECPNCLLGYNNKFCVLYEKENERYKPLFEGSFKECCKQYKLKSFI